MHVHQERARGDDIEAGALAARLRAGAGARAARAKPLASTTAVAPATIDAPATAAACMAIGAAVRRSMRGGLADDDAVDHFGLGLRSGLCHPP